MGVLTVRATTVYSPGRLRPLHLSSCGICAGHYDSHACILRPSPRQDDLPTLYRALHRLVEDFPEHDRAAMFHGNAWRLYKCGAGGLHA